MPEKGKGKGRKGAAPSQAPRFFPRVSLPVDDANFTQVQIDISSSEPEKISSPVASDAVSNASHKQLSDAASSASETEADNGENDKFDDKTCYDITAHVEFSEIDIQPSNKENHGNQECAVDAEKSFVKQSLYEVIDGCCHCKKDCSLSTESSVIICGTCVNRMHTDCYLALPHSSCPVCKNKMFSLDFATTGELVDATRSRTEWIKKCTKVTAELVESKDETVKAKEESIQCLKETGQYHQELIRYHRSVIGKILSKWEINSSLVFTCFAVVVIALCEYCTRSGSQQAVEDNKQKPGDTTTEQCQDAAQDTKANKKFKNKKKSKQNRPK